MTLAELVDGPGSGRPYGRAVVAALVPERGERDSRTGSPQTPPFGGWGGALDTLRNEPRRTGEPVGPAGAGAVDQFCETH